MATRTIRSALKFAAIALLCVSLAGCAARQAYRSAHELLAAGKYEEGLSKLEEAVQRAPSNVEYRIALQSKRESIVQDLLRRADAAYREGRATDAEQAYKQIQRIEPDNAMARQGLQAIATERRHRAQVAEMETLFRKDETANAAAALAGLRAVLAENPRQKEAVNLRARIEAVLAEQAPNVARLAGAYNKPITLEFRDAPLKSVFDAIAKISGLNFFFDKDIRPDLRATILARDTSIADAIKILLVTNQLEQRVLGDNAILIYPNTPQKLKDYQTLMLRTFFLANADVKSVSNTLKTLLKTQDLVVDERLGLIMMRDTPEAIRLAEKLIGLQDQSDPEVMLEVEILEIKRSTLTELGIRLPEQATLAPLVSEGQLLTLEQLLDVDRSTTQVGVGNVILNARKEDQDGNILANPRIRVRNKDAAMVLIGDRVPVITTTSTSTGFVSESVTYVDVGLKLEVEPNIYLDGEVAIKIKLEVSNLVREVISKSGTLAYQIGTRSANTVLRLKDGETQILAGLISDEERATGNKVPMLGDLPMLGRLFGSRKNDHQRSEIVLSITPRLIRSLRRPDLVAAEFESGTQTSLGASSLNFSSGEGEQSEQGQEPAAVPNGAAADSAQPPAPAQPAPAQPETLQPQPAASPENNTADATVTPAPASAPVVVPTTAPAPAPRIDQPAQKAAATGNVRLQWRGPKQVRAGEQFDVSLQLTSEVNLRSLPVMLGFDPRHLQVVRVQEGDYLKQAGASTSFNQRVDAAQGRIFIAAVRQSTPGADSGTNGAGSVLSVTFKAIAAGKANVKALSITPEPPHDISGALPAAHVIEIVQ